MPKSLERKLKATAKSRHYGNKRSNAYIFGTLRKLGWKPKRRKGR